MEGFITLLIFILLVVSHVSIDRYCFKIFVLVLNILRWTSRMSSIRLAVLIILYYDLMLAY